jgi:5'-nucleotidase
MHPLRILISNDDGVFAEGIRALANAAAARGHRVTVVCPDQERSATGHGLTLQTPLRAERADALFAEGVVAWACSGTPSDCVKLALGRLLAEPPDLVLSGINHGPNLGSDVFYSGTVSAAMEGTLEGLKALAEQMLAGGWPEGLLLNLNVPAQPAAAIGPVRWCRPAVRRYVDQFDCRTDPRGRTYYWLAGEVVNDLEAATAGPRDWPTDVEQVHSGGAALTPLQPELFWRGALSQLAALDPLLAQGSLSAGPL